VKRSFDLKAWGVNIKRMIYRFIDDKGTFVIEDPQRIGLYFPLTDAVGSILSSISPGLSGDIKKDNEHFLTPPASILDLKTNPLCCRDFFVKTGNKTIRLSRPSKDSLEAGLLYHRMIKRTGGLSAEVLNFIPYDLGVEVMWVKLANTGKKQIDITPTSFIPLYARSEKNLRDHRHVTSLLNRITLDKYGIILKPTMIFDEKGHSVNRTNYFVLGFEGSSKPPEGQFPTLDSFFGESDIFSPDAVEKQLKPFTKKADWMDGKEACAALRFSKARLERDQKKDYFLVMGIEDDAKKIKETFLKLDSPEKIEEAFQRTRRYWQDYLASVRFDFKDKNLNNWLIWVKFQPTLRRLFGCSFLPHFDYGKGGRGWRDLWQDSLSLLHTQPDKAKQIIMQGFKGVRLDGSNATIITSDGRFIADRNRINRVWMDHGIWPFLTTRLYLDISADLDLLLKDQTYFRDHQLRRAMRIDKGFSQKDFIQRSKDEKVYHGSILEHLLVQNLVQFFNVGIHNCVRLENADWNDGLDMASEHGESAAFSFMYGRTLRDICICLERLKEKRKSIFIFKELKILLDRISAPVNYDDYKAKQKRLSLYFERIENFSGRKVEIRLDELIDDLKSKSEHMLSWLSKKEWLKEGFFNGYYDNRSKRVEGGTAGKLRMLLQSQVFAIMSGAADNSQIKRDWLSIKKHLRDKQSGGFRLNTDLKSVYMDLGRAFGFSYGDKENGAFFSHMNVMLANALYSRGFIKEGFEVLDSIYKMAKDERSGIPPVLPEYFNNQGKGLYLYLTGSASWYVHTLIEEVLGIRFSNGDILLEPKLIQANFAKDNIEFDFWFKEKPVTVIYFKQTGAIKPLKVKKVLFNLKPIFPGPKGFIIRSSQFKASGNTIKAYLS
jgi:cellobiose phosphorylase